MWPKIGPVATYGILYILSIVLHFHLSQRIARRCDLEGRVWMAVSLCYLLGMLPGAKFLYHWYHVEFDPTVIFCLEHYVQGGLWGGMLAYLLLALPLALLLTRRRWDALDLIAVSLPIPWSLTKLGCVLNGCCHGRSCSWPWAITFPEGASSAPAGIPLHPTQVYEIILMGLILLVFKLLLGGQWRGTMLFWLIGIYGLGRAAIDVFRGDVDRYVYLGSVTLTQIICLVAAVVSFVLLFFSRQWIADEKNGSVPVP